jgi:hypothetical protein
MEHRAQKEAADLKKKLEDTEQKAKDAAADLQAVIEGKCRRCLVLTVHALQGLGAESSTLDLCRA